MSDFPRDLRPAAVGEVALSVDEVAHGVWVGVIHGPRAWRVLGDRISVQADAMGAKLVPVCAAGGALRSRLASSSRPEVSTGVE